MMEQGGQLHLPLEFLVEPTLEAFFPGPNREALAAVELLTRGAAAARFLYLFGAPATGKTHLLQAACRAVSSQGQRAQWLALGTPGLAPAVLEDLEHCDLVALDGLDAVAGQAAWEQALFALINRLREDRRRLAVAAGQPPDYLPIALADLRSRLHWGPRYRLLPLSDEDCAQWLAVLAARRGFRLEEAQIRYILTNAPRDPASLSALLARIDALSLREQRPPTLPLIRRALLPEAPDDQSPCASAASGSNPSTWR